MNPMLHRSNPSTESRNRRTPEWFLATWRAAALRSLPTGLGGRGIGEPWHSRQRRPIPLPSERRAVRAVHKLPHVRPRVCRDNVAACGVLTACSRPKWFRKVARLQSDSARYQPIPFTRNGPIKSSSIADTSSTIGRIMSTPARAAASSAATLRFMFSILP